MREYLVGFAITFGVLVVLAAVWIAYFFLTWDLGPVSF